MKAGARGEPEKARARERSRRGSTEAISLIQNAVFLMVSLGSGGLGQGPGAPELWVILLWGTSVHRKATPRT